MPRRSFLNLSAVTLSSFAANFLGAKAAESTPPLGDGKLRIIVFGAHPDDAEYRGAGVAMKWAKLGHHVKLVSATNGDIEVELRDGVASLEFERTAPTLRDAILAAIREVETAGFGVRVLRVESEGANVIARINADLSAVAGG